MKLDLKTIAVVLLIGIVVFQQFDKNNVKKKPGDTIYIQGKPHEVIKHEIDTFEVVKRDTVEKKGKDIYHDTTIYVTVPQAVDTGAVLKEYFAKKFYRDTLKLSDNLGTVVINDTISQNAIHHRKYYTKVSQRYINDMMIVREAQRTQIYYGGNMGFDRTNFLNSINAGLIMKTKKDRIYQVGVGFMGQPAGTPLSPFVMGGAYWKIKLKKD